MRVRPIILYMCAAQNVGKSLTMIDSWARKRQSEYLQYEIVQGQTDHEDMMYPGIFMMQ